MKIIKAKIKKDKPSLAHRSKWFVCMKCGCLVKGTIFDIDTNKFYCSIHPTEEVIDLSPIFLFAMMHPEMIWNEKDVTKAD